MTLRLYYTDATLLSFEATVVAQAGDATRVAHLPVVPVKTAVRGAERRLAFGTDS